MNNLYDLADFVIELNVPDKNKPDELELNVVKNTHGPCVRGVKLIREEDGVIREVVQPTKQKHAPGDKPL